MKQNELEKQQRERELKREAARQKRVSRVLSFVWNIHCLHFCPQREEIAAGLRQGSKYGTDGDKESVFTSVLEAMQTGDAFRARREKTETTAQIAVGFKGPG